MISSLNIQYLILCLLLVGCTIENPQFPSETVQGYRPIYAAPSLITFELPRPIQNPGKVHLYKNYILIGDLKKGIHFIDNSDPENPTAVGFLRIEENVDYFLKGDALFIDHQNNLVSLNISNLNAIQEISRVDTWSPIVPPIERNYFECVDPRRGVVVDWEFVTLVSPKCYR